MSQIAEIPVRSALRGYDNTFNYLWLRSAMVDGDWDFRNDLEQCDTLAADYRASALALTPTATGRIPNKYGIGWAAVTLPFYLAADAIVSLGRWLGLWTLERDGFNPVYQIVIQVGHGALALLALWIASRVVAAWIGSKAAAQAGVLAVWAASPLFYYQTANVSMSHGVGFFAVTCMAYAVMRAAGGGSSSCEAVPASPRVAASQELGPPPVGNACHADWRWWLLAGAGWGLAAITRFQLVVFGVVAVAGVLASHANSRSVHSTFKAVAWCAAGALPFLGLQAWAWRCVYGEWLVFSYGAEAERFHWLAPEFFNSFFSSWHGLFYWHPFLLLALGGAVAWILRSRGEAWGWGGAWLLSAYLGAAWWCWWFASAFGNRSYDAALLPLMAGMAWLFARLAPRWINVLWAAAIAAGLWNFYLALLYRAGAISRNEPVTWLEMLAAGARLPAALQF